MTTQPLVTVIMPVFNQVRYVAQAIESVLAQESDFSIKLVISDDSSTDGTAEICRRYANNYYDRIEFRTQKVNVGMSKNYVSLFNACYSKYIAVLEGDDFWIDKFKLKKQVSILEADRSIGVVHSNFQALLEDGTVKAGHNFVRQDFLSGNIFENLFIENRICPATVCFRRSLLRQSIDIDFLTRNPLKTIDYFLWIGMAHASKFFYLCEVTACYRIHPQSISNNASVEKFLAFVRSSEAIIDYYAKRYGVRNSLVRNAISEIYSPVVLRNVAAANYHDASVYVSKIRSRKFKFLLIKLLALPRSRPLYIAYRGFLTFGSLIKHRLIRVLMKR